MSAPAFSFMILIVITIVSFFVWLVYSRRYQRASQEVAFVRTGYGGRKVVMSGGALVFPVLHETTPVNMNTMRLEVARSNNQALITKDRMRMDVQAEFYVRVKPTPEDVSLAAQTLGRRSTNIESLKNLLEGKFVNALRESAAEMNMDELHQTRGEFVRRVRESVGDGLSKNGLELESVSLSELEQTDRKYFNPQNAFDAEGLMILTELIQNRTRQRNAIERDTEVAIREKDLQAERQKLELAKLEEFARLEQEREIQIRRAEQKTMVVSEQVEKEREAREAELMARKSIEKAQLCAEQEIEEERIAKGQALKEKDLARDRAVEVAETNLKKEIQEARIEAEKLVELARIHTEQAIENERLQKERYLADKEIERDKHLTVLKIQKDLELKEQEIAAEEQTCRSRLLSQKVMGEEEIAKERCLRDLEIARDRFLQIAEIERRKSIELADVTRLIALSEIDRDHLQIQTEVDRNRALAVEAEEKVVTARELEIAERRKAVDLVEAHKQAERETIAIVETAEARMKAAVSQAETVGIVAGGEADKIRKISEAEAEAGLIKLKTEEKRFKVESEGRRAMHEAENVLDSEKTAARVKTAIIENMPAIIRESVKPIEAIEGIRIMQVEGLTGRFGNGHGDGETPAGGGNLADQLVNSALRYRGQAPLVDSILREIGISGGDLNGLTKPLVGKPEDDSEST